MTRPLAIVSIILLTIALTCLPASTLRAEGDEGLSFSGDLRWRYEADGKDFNGDTDMRTFNTVRPRLGIKYESFGVTSFLQIQYPHKLDRDAAILSDYGAPSVHQAYLKISRLIRPELAMKVGRMELKYGDERLIGPVGWSHIGRAFDGFLFALENDRGTIDFFVTQLVDRSYMPTGNPPDDRFYGLWAACKKTKLNIFFLDRVTSSRNQNNDWQIAESRMTMGLHYKNQYPSNIGTLLDFAYQMGTMKDFTTFPTQKTDIAAWMLVFKLWYQFPTVLKPSLGLGVDMVTGDDPKSADKNEAFDNLYYTGHKWRGIMDLFVESNSEGLRDIFVKAAVNPMPGFGATLAIHNFATSEKYASFKDGSEVTALGNEIDLDLEMMIRPNLSCCMWLGYFIPSEDWKGSDADDAMWIYAQMQMTFEAGLK
ncbi:MAG: alginate export family protein [Calditrichota bacterium]